jgi:hypothetical protein
VEPLSSRITGSNTEFHHISRRAQRLGGERISFGESDKLEAAHG